MKHKSAQPLTIFVQKIFHAIEKTVKYKATKKHVEIKWGRKFFKYVLLFNSNKSPTRCNNFPVYYPEVYLPLNMFRAFSRPSSEAQ
jgi:hypothetical protein